MKSIKLFDIEIYRNYFLIVFQDLESGKFDSWEFSEGEKLDRKSLLSYVKKHCLVSFNGINFDMLILSGALAGFGTSTLKDMTNDIIQNQMKPWDVEKAYRIERFKPWEVDHIDLIELPIGTASLKLYNGRLHGKTMQDLPIEHDAVLTPKQMDKIFEYCCNDLSATKLLYQSLSKQIELRIQMSKQYGIDLRSKSDAQIAEAVLGKEVARVLGRKVEKTSAIKSQVKFTVPSFIKFKRKNLNDLLDLVTETNFSVGLNGAVVLPESLSDMTIKMGRSIYRFGIGGLHSSEQCQGIKAEDDEILEDRDVASYYPAIIIGQKLAPKQMGSAFQPIYRDIVKRRLEAKKSGDKVVSEALKIVLNGSFGKFGNRWSILYSPQLLIQTTITGQLALLMFIERFEEKGISIVSANTDGIVIHCKKNQVELKNQIIAQWEKETGFATEATNYSAIYSRDINNYIAIKTDGTLKRKGAYAEGWMGKNPANEICTDAVCEYLLKGVSLKKTITECTDVRKFLTVRQVNGGGICGDVFLGKAVRWYYAKGSTAWIHYKLTNKKGNHNKVARSEGCKPLMILPDELPNDIDYDWYIREARSLLLDIGAHARLI